MTDRPMPIRPTPEPPTRGPGGLYSSADEGALIEWVRRGDTAAFDALVRRYLRRAYAVAYRLLGHREDAEDLVQEAFMAALDHIDRFEPGRPFGPWFFRLLTNRASNFRKARAVRRTEPVHDAVDDGRSSPYLDAARAEVRERFRAALAALPERQRLIVQLVDVDGLQAAEVATMLDLSAGTVRWYLHEARTTLRTALAPLRERDE